MGEVVEGGTAIVEGRVVAKSELAVPEGGQRCVWYDALVESFSSGSRGGRLLWMPERAEARCAGFYLEDETGRLWVPEDARPFDVSGARRVAGPVGREGTKRYVAHYLQAGDTLRIQGRVDKPVGRKEPAGVLVLRPKDDGRLVVIVQRRGEPKA